MKPRQWFNIATQPNGDGSTDVMIFDYIGNYGGNSVSAQDFCEALNAIKTPKINVRINSGGGDFFDAATIYNAIKEHDSEITCHVDGLAASAASIVAIAGDRTLIAKNGFMMIHNVMSMCFGAAADMRKEADVLDKLCSSTAGLYAAKSGKKPEEMSKLMDDETWFGADEAHAAGLADEVKDPDANDDDDATMNIALRAVAQYKKLPERLRKFAASVTVKPKENSMLKPIARDGKHFVNIGGVEHEVEISVPQPPAAAAAVVQMDPEKIRNEAVTREREYRAAFNTAMGSAGIAGKGAEDFEKSFYGRPIDDIKFLASNAIGKRATPVGEGGGDASSEAEKAAKEKNEIRTYCAGRFAKDGNLRRRFRVNTASIDDASYKAGLEKFIAVETKCRADEAAPAKSDNDSDGNDPISRLMKNKSVFQRV